MGHCDRSGMARDLVQQNIFTGSCLHEQAQMSCGDPVSLRILIFQQLVIYFRAELGLKIVEFDI